MTPVRKLLLIILSFVFFFAVTSSSTFAISPSQLDCNTGFSELFSGIPGILYKRVVFDDPRIIIAHIVKVDLNDEDLDIATTPRELLGNYTTTFLGTVGAAVAINGSGFESDYIPFGFNASQGDSYGTEGSGGFVFSSSEINESMISYSVFDPLWDVLSGFNTLITGGSINDDLSACFSNCTASCDQAYCLIRARTTIGMDNSNHLTIIVVEEEPLLGASLSEMATMQDVCGMENAINLDGGGSSTLAVNAINTARPGYNILNNVSPERYVSNHLAICVGTCEISDSLANNYIPDGEARPRPSDLLFPFDCDSVAPDNAFSGDSEFHSLRPYQASPCNPNKENLALFCGNDLFVGDYLTITKDSPDADTEIYYFNGSEIIPHPPSDLILTVPLCEYCGPDGTCLSRPPPCIYQPGMCDNCHLCEESEDGSTETCSFTLPTTEKDIAVDVSGAEFPIMGYTEPSVGNEDDPYRVVNSTYTDEETVDHATKMNEYVSWYLNGVINRAEYPFLDATLECVGESSDKIGYCRHTQPDTDGSGELKCLTEWPFPINLFTDPFESPTLTPDGKDVCTGDMYCCVLPALLSDETSLAAGKDTVLNYSGPIKKLYPFSLQNTERKDESEDGYESDVNDAGIRHNQVAACHSNFLVTLIELIGGDEFDFPDFLVPRACYGNTFFGLPINWLLTRERLSDFFENPPPIEEDDPYLGEDFSDWLIAYKEWRGYSCASFTLNLPIINNEFTFYLCFDTPWEPNVYGNLFPYVPFSSTEDRKGDIKIKSVVFAPALYTPNVRILYSRIVGEPENANMYVPHMEEDVQLAEMAQSIYAYQGSDTASMEYSGFIPDSDYCEFVDVRSNPGDDLFAGELSATVEYQAEITCTFLNWGDGRLCNALAGGVCVTVPLDRWYYAETSYGQYDCADGQLCVDTNLGTASLNDDGSCTGYFSEWGEIGCYPNNFVVIGTDTPCEVLIPTYCPDSNFICTSITSDCVRNNETPTSTQTCTYPVMANIKLETRTPLAHTAWARLVAGSAGIFRKMFPQIGGEDSTFDGIIDMPASTDVSYRPINPDGTTDTSSILYVGDPANQTSGSQAKLYFPHIGGVKEYFLTGIQTLLRPKGMGRQPVFCEGDECQEANSPLIDSADDSDGSTETPTSDQCEAISDSTLLSSHPEASSYLGAVKDAFISYCNLFGETNLAEACYNDMVSRSLEVGVNPAFTMSIWISESTCSNYEQTLGQDFGYTTVPIQNFSEQINAYLDHDNPFWTYADRCQGSFDNYTHAFLFVYRAGDSDGICGPDNPEDEIAGDWYYGFIGDIWASFLYEAAPSCYMPPNPHILDCP